MRVADPAEVASLLDTSLRLKSYENERALRLKYGVQPLVPAYVAAFPRVKAWFGRATILTFLLGYTRTNPDVVKLATSAVRDKSRQVRECAIEILAYSLRRELVPVLRQVALSKDDQTRENALAAIDAIEHQNHHYFVDREHSGTTFWSVEQG